MALWLMLEAPCRSTTPAETSGSQRRWVTSHHQPNCWRSLQRRAACNSPLLLVPVLNHQSTQEFTSEDYQQLMSTNLESAFNLSQVRIPNGTRSSSTSAPIPLMSSQQHCQCVHSSRALHVLNLSLRMQLAYPLLEASGKGSIVMNSSVAGGPAAINTGSLYAMSKGATQPPSSAVERTGVVVLLVLHLFSEHMRRKTMTPCHTHRCHCSGNEPAHQEPGVRVGDQGHPSERGGALVSNLGAVVSRCWVSILLLDVQH